MKTAITAVPNIARRLEKKVCTKSCRRLRVLTPVETAASCWICASAMLIPHSWVEYPVEDVYKQVHEHEEQGAVEDYALDHGVVPAVDGLVGDLAHPRPGEDRLGDERPAHQEADLEPDHRDRRQHSVPQGVLEDHPPRYHPLGAGRPDVVLVHDLEHAAPRHARHHRHRDGPEGHGR